MPCWTSLGVGMHADMYGTCTVCVCGHVCASISSQWLRWHAELPCLASLSGRLLVVRSADPVKGQTATEARGGLGQLGTVRSARIFISVDRLLESDLLRLHVGSIGRNGGG